MKTAIAYLRVSTEGQEDKYGLEAQREAIEQYARENDYNVINWYEEVGSGAHRRPILDSIALGGVVGNPPVEALLVYKSDRVARDIQNFFYYLLKLGEKGIDLICLKENFPGLDKPVRDLLYSLFQFTAMKERENISMRTAAGRKVKAQSGGYSGGRIAYGYYALNHELEVDEEEAELVREIFRCKGEGKGLSETARELNSKGFKTRNGSPISASNVKSIRENEKFYQGYYRYSDTEWVRGKHKPLIGEV